MAATLRDQMIPAVYHPTTVVMMDDDAEFLSSAALHMDGFPTARFTSYHEALDFVRRWGDSRIGHSSDVRAWLANPERFRTVSVVLVDYQLDIRNGIEFCRETARLPVRKIMVSGEMSDPAAIELLNDDVVERYVSKTDPNRWDAIGEFVRQMQDRFMCLEHPGRAPDSGFHAAKVHADPVFKQWLSGYCRSQNFVEFIRVPAGFLLVDASGAVSLLVVRDGEELRSFNQRARDVLQAPGNVLRTLKQGRTLVHNPDDLWGDRLLAVAASERYWRERMHEGRLVNGIHDSYLVAQLDDVRPYPDEAEYCYDDYLEELRERFGASWEL